MSILTLQPMQTLAADGDALAGALRRGRVANSDLIRVAGPSGLAAVLWLCRHGYDRAVCVRGETVPFQPPADALVIPHPCGARELARLIRDGDGLKDGGALIVQAAAADGGEGPDSLSVFLEIRGYRVEHRIAGKGLSVLVARRSGSGDLKKAA